jgi:hypothetical protein
MMGKARLPVLLVSLLLAVSCSDSGGKGETPGETLEGFSQAETYQEKAAWLTSGTRKLIDRFVDREIVTGKSRDRLLPPLVKGSDWKVLSREEGEDRAILQLQLTDHPVENMAGYSFSVTLKKEDEGWRIDMEDELERRLESRKDLPDIESYLKNR